MATDDPLGRRDHILAELDRIAATGPHLYRLERLADDVGRLRRHLAALVDNYDDTLTAHRVERVARHVEVLHASDRPTAADRHRAGTPLDEALAEVDREAATLRRRLGPRPRRKLP